MQDFVHQPYDIFLALLVYGAASLKVPRTVTELQSQILHCCGLLI